MDLRAFACIKLIVRAMFAPPPRLLGLPRTSRSTWPSTDGTLYHTEYDFRSFAELQEARIINCVRTCGEIYQSYMNLVD